MRSREEFDFIEHGGRPPPEILELCHELAIVIEEIVTDPDLWFKHPRLNMVRLVIQSKLLDFAAEVARIDRMREGPEFFGTVPQRLRYERPAPKPQPPLRSWIRTIRRKVHT